MNAQTIKPTKMSHTFQNQNRALTENRIRDPQSHPIPMIFVWLEAPNTSAWRVQSRINLLMEDQCWSSEQSTTELFSKKNNGNEIDDRPAGHQMTLQSRKEPRVHRCSVM
jgi:hypothetical protein